MRRTPIVAAAALALGLAGCGSSTSSAIAHDAQAHYASKDARCRKAGLMLFVGKRTAVYDCKLIGVDPAHRPPSSSRATTWTGASSAPTGTPTRSPSK
jgi:hypothetical protein